MTEAEADADTRDVFISYARPSEEEAHRISQLLRDAGFSVWRDDELPAHRAYLGRYRGATEVSKGSRRTVVGGVRKIALGARGSR